MSNLISSAFYFDDDAVRLDSLAALGIDPNSINSGEVLYVTDNAITLDNSTHAGKIILVDTTALDPCTITVPDDVNSGFAETGFVTIIRFGDGQVNFEAGSGATLNCAGNLALNNKFSVGYLNKIEENQWILSGDLAGTSEFNDIVDEVLALTTSMTVPSDLIPSTTPASNSDELTFSALGGTCTRPVSSNVIQISNNFGAPFEAEINGVNILPLNIGGTFTVSSITPGSTAQSFSLFIGVTQFPFRTDKWVKAGIKISYARTTSLWAVERIANGAELIVGSTSSAAPTSVTCAYNNSTSQLTTTAFGASDITTIANYTPTLYSRIFVTGDPGGISFSLTFTGATNGKGKRILTKLEQGDAIVEVESYRIN